MRPRQVRYQAALRREGAFLKEHEVYDFTVADFEQDRETLHQLRMRELSSEPALEMVVVADTAAQLPRPDLADRSP
jgi:hypothetical protein